jgi:hypothetical protein
MSRRRKTKKQSGEPRVTLYSHEWRNGMFLIGAIPEPERGYYRAFFAHLETGWKTVRVLQIAAESLLHGHSPCDDVANWVDVEITDNFRWLAFACLQMIPNVRIFDAELEERLNEGGFASPFGQEPPVDELEPEAQMLGRNVRLLAMMEGAAGFPHALRGIVAPAASALTAWERALPAVAAPVVAYVISRTL